MDRIKAKAKGNQNQDKGKGDPQMTQMTQMTQMKKQKAITDEKAKAKSTAKPLDRG